ncbi:unnamed protein product, partial [Rotaria magnacalcarata]
NGAVTGLWAQHVDVFERLKKLIYLDIYSKIHFEKVEPYRLITQNRFPNSHFDVQVSKFRLWV